MYRKLKRVWSHNDMNYIPKFKETFPELNKVSSEDMCDRWIELGVDFYTDEKTPVKTWMRFTLPVAISLMILMVIGIPFCFLITGKWTYPLGEKNRILNWFRSLRLL
jgi:hypothetical protein